MHSRVRRQGLEKTVPRDGDEPGNSWLDSMFIVVANVVGVGVLGLAHAFAKLGWLSVSYRVVMLTCDDGSWGIITLAVTLAGSLYSGLLLTRMKTRVPQAVVYADLGYAAFGDLGQAFVTLFAYTYMTGVCLSFQLTASLFLKEMTNGLCFVYCATLVAAVVLPLAQYRNFSELTSISVIGALSIVAPTLLIIVEVAWNGRFQPVETEWITDAGFEAATVACMDVVFAMAGHVFFVEIMSEMQDPRAFRHSLYCATSFLSWVYFAVAIVGYYFIGPAVLNPITNNLSSVVVRRWCSAFVLCHIVVAYVMAVMVLARGIEDVVFLRPHEDSKHASLANRMSWFGLTSAIVFLGFLVANVLPFVNDLLGFVGAMSGVTTTFVFPFLLAPVILKDELSVMHTRALQAVACFSCIVAVVGVVCSVHRMSNSYETRSPFSC
ncbi:amino acid transporter, AAAP family [Achlya hypogyna]|uniref:Amino acid transporter, AAAP family n=1 Tax=Achlya hypogyna TaxID=1202772 RepID=A0A1V9ZJH7_ACHHY|nr:amino acid transporter, AAAP family [Achlya hypogyna]